MTAAVATPKDREEAYAPRKVARESATPPPAVTKAETIARADTSRLSLVLPAKSVERLEKLKLMTEASSFAEVIRNAIRLYEAVVVEYEKGNKVQIVDKAGTPLTINIF